MYVIKTCHSHRDMDVPSRAVRFLHDNPQKVMEVVEELKRTEEETAFDIFVFMFTVGELISLRDYRQLADDPLTGIYMYHGCQNQIGKPWHEKWNEEFVRLL